jgi:hypothetical protein
MPGSYASCMMRLNFFRSPASVRIAGLTGSLAAVLLSLPSGAVAQSLDSKHPTPLVAGENTGTVDSMVGPQFWSFQTRTGSASIVVRFAAMGLFGNASASTIQVVLHDSTGKQFAAESVTSTGKPVEVAWPGTFPKPATVILEIRPAMSSLIRTGGDYSVQVTGAVAFSNAKPPGPERIAGTYSLMVCPPTLDCQAVRFFPNGTVKTADGTTGTWTSFDPQALIYTVKIGSNQWSLKLVPGRGLVDAANTSGIIFQAVR